MTPLMVMSRPRRNPIAARTRILHSWIMIRERIWTLFALPMLGAFLGFLISAVTTYVMPRMYESTAKVQIHIPQKVDRTSDEAVSAFLLHEMRKFRDADIMDSVINNLDLTNRWAMEKSKAHTILERSVKTERLRDTDLIAITARHTNRSDARDIAHAVVQAYQLRRNEMAKKEWDGFVEEFESEIRKQESVAEKMCRKFEAIEGTGTDSEEFRKAKSDWEIEQGLLDQMRVKLASETITRKLPDRFLTVYEYPEESRIPVSPKVNFNLLLGTCLGMLSGITIALFMLWMASRSDRVF